jgi:hypothetical protein
MVATTVDAVVELPSTENLAVGLEPMVTTVTITERNSERMRYIYNDRS